MTTAEFTNPETGMALAVEGVAKPKRRFADRLRPLVERVRRSVPDRFTAVQGVGAVAFGYGAVDTFGVGVGLMIVGPLVFAFSGFAEWAGSRSS